MHADDKSFPLSGAPKLNYKDPLANPNLPAMLDEAVNAHGSDILIGDNCTLWGGKAAQCVGIVLGDGVRLYDGCRLVVDHLCKESGITLGNGVALNFNCYIDGSGGVDLGANTILGPNVVIVSSSHGTAEARNQKHLAPVKLGKRVWVGANTVIMAGITIGDGATVGAGSVVTRDVEPGATVVGNPARPIAAG